MSKSKKRHGRFFRYVPLILWIGVILFASTTQASMSNTSRFVRPFLEFLFPAASEASLHLYQVYIRKIMHLFEYGVLAFFASRAFWSSGKEILRRFWYLAAFLLVLTVASIDEINQSFNQTRTGSIYDVLLDGFGGILMIFLILTVRKFLKRKQPE